MVEKIKELGVVAFFNKPFDKEKFGFFKLNCGDVLKSKLRNKINFQLSLFNSKPCKKYSFENNTYNGHYYLDMQKDGLSNFYNDSPLLEDIVNCDREIKFSNLNFCKFLFFYDKLNPTFFLGSYCERKINDEFMLIDDGKLMPFYKSLLPINFNLDILVIDEDVYFKSFSKMSQFFRIRKFYEKYAESEISLFYKLFDFEDLEFFNKRLTAEKIKKIKSILDSNILTNNLENLVKRSEELEIELKLNKNKIVIPTDSTKLRILFKFLIGDILKNNLDNQNYLVSNKKFYGGIEK